MVKIARTCWAVTTSATPRIHIARNLRFLMAVLSPAIGPARLGVSRSVALFLRLTLTHVLPLFRLPVPAAAGAVIDAALGVHPDLDFLALGLLLRGGYRIDGGEARRGKAKHD